MDDAIAVVFSEEEPEVLALLIDGPIVNLDGIDRRPCDWPIDGDGPMALLGVGDGFGGRHGRFLEHELRPMFVVVIGFIRRRVA